MVALSEHFKETAPLPTLVGPHRAQPQFLSAAAYAVCEPRTLGARGRAAVQCGGEPEFLLVMHVMPYRHRRRDLRSKSKNIQSWGPASVADRSGRAVPGGQGHGARRALGPARA